MTLPLLALLVLFLLVGVEIASAVRRSRKPASPEDGCCGCGADTCDVLVGGRVGRGEGYCWSCCDTWPATATPVAELGLFIFPDHERAAR